MAHSSGDFNILAPRSKFYQGPFGRLFPELPAWSPKFNSDEEIVRHFLAIANKEMIEVVDSSGEMPEKPSAVDADPALDSRIPAGYTYFGQFIDHDITFDPASSLMRQNDPNGLLNHRTPRLDLDNVYGAGPDASPYLYDKTQRGKLLTELIPGTTLHDLPRNSPRDIQGIALIGDKRNDENAIVAQLQLAFILAHNKLVDKAIEIGSADPFQEARTTLRWLYQFVVWNDFVKRIANDKIHDAALMKVSAADGRTKWEPGLDDVYSWRNNPFVPVEFSVAAYRFGHSMVRNTYQTNADVRGFHVFAPIFDNSGAVQDPDDLRGFRPLTAKNYVQWDWFLEMGIGGEFPQRARKIDPKLSNALAFLHEGPAGSPMNILAFRNLLRGYRFGLPSGTDVARKLCINPIEIDPNHDSLWFYILKEAGGLPGNDAGQMLGQVGSTIVCATFAGLLLGDPSSYFNIEPCWNPDMDELLMHFPDLKQDSGDWSLAYIIRLSGLPVHAGEIS